MGKKNKNRDVNTANNDEGTDEDEGEDESDDMLTLDPSLDNSMENLTSEDGVMGNQAKEQAEGDDAKKEEGGEQASELPTLDTLGESTPEEPAKSESDASTDAPASDADKPLDVKAPEAPTVASDEAVKAADEDVKSEAGEGEGKQPELSTPHEEAQPVVDAAPGPLEELKQAANIAGPALKKLGGFSEAIEKLEDEARARFDFARQKMTEAVAALESIFTRD